MARFGARALHKFRNSLDSNPRAKVTDDDNFKKGSSLWDKPKFKMSQQYTWPFSIIRFVEWQLIFENPMYVKVRQNTAVRLPHPASADRCRRWLVDAAALPAVEMEMVCPAIFDAAIQSAPSTVGEIGTIVVGMHQLARVAGPRNWRRSVRPPRPTYTGLSNGMNCAKFLPANRFQC